jgi:hypothetical protein
MDPSSAPLTLEKLNALVEGGGEPVGMIAVTLKDGAGRFCTRPLREYQGEEWAEKYLKQLMSTVAEEASKLHGCEVIYSRDRDGWLM